MRIAILHDGDALRADAPAEQRAVLNAVAGVEAALVRGGHEAALVPVTGDVAGTIHRLERSRAQLVFNLCEAVGGDSASEPQAAALVELLGLPMTGSPSETLALARRKDRVNAILAAAGIAVPAWALATDADDASGWRHFPAIVKPAGEDGSVGLSCRSVAHDRNALRTALAETCSGHGPALVQAFVGGRELAVGLVGERALPVSEIDFSGLPHDCPPIVSYAAKWAPGCPEDLGTRPICPAELEPDTAGAIVALARTVWRLLGGRGYGRVDLRLDDGGRPCILDVNPNADLDPSAGLARMAAVAGWSYDTLIERIVREAAS